jgi:hypothetical protein
MEKSPDMLKFLLTGLDKKYHPEYFNIEDYS